MNAAATTFAVTSAANAIAAKFSAEDIQIIASVLMQLSDTLITISAINDKNKNKIAENKE